MGLKLTLKANFRNSPLEARAVTSYYVNDRSQVYSSEVREVFEACINGIGYMIPFDQDDKDEIFKGLSLALLNIEISLNPQPFGCKYFCFVICEEEFLPYNIPDDTVSIPFD